MAAKKKSGKTMKCATGGMITRPNAFMTDKDLAKAGKVNLNVGKMPTMTPKKAGKKGM